MMLPTLMYSLFSPVLQKNVLHLGNGLYTQFYAVDAKSVFVRPLTRFFSFYVDTKAKLIPYASGRIAASSAPDVHELIRAVRG